MLGVASWSSLGFIHLFLTLAHLDLAPSRHWYAEMNGDTVSFLSISTVKGETSSVLYWVPEPCTQ